MGVYSVRASKTCVFNAYAAEECVPGVHVAETCASELYVAEATFSGLGLDSGCHGFGVCVCVSSINYDRVEFNQAAVWFTCGL